MSTNLGAHQAEGEARNRLNKNIPPKMEKWEGRLNSITYANIPRLTQRLPITTVGIETLNELLDGFPDGYIARYLSILANAVQSFEIDAVPLEMFSDVSNKNIGTIISFDFNGWTKNGSKYYDKPVPVSTIRTFDEKKSLHFYFKNNDWKWVFPYDPKWVTTNTAHSEFNSGRAYFAGLGIIKNCFPNKKEVRISPLVVGLPRRDFHDKMG